MADFRIVSFFLIETKPLNNSSKPRPAPLTINITQSPPNPSESRNDGFVSSSNSSKPTVDQLTHKVQMLDITATQKDKLEEFLKCREKIGDLTNDDLSVEGELGSGNGGVVLKVRHRKFNTAMAKKVKYFNLYLLWYVALRTNDNSFLANSFGNKTCN